MKILPQMKVVGVCLMLCFQFFILHAQSTNEGSRYLEGQFYFKVQDDFSTFFNSQSPEVNIREQLPFFVPIAEEFGATVQSSFYFSESEKLYRTFRTTIKEPRRAEEFLKVLREQSEVEYAIRIPLFEINHTPDDYIYPRVGSLWHLDTIKATNAWALSKGDGVIVAVVDNGFDEYHSDLKSKWISGFGYRTDASGAPALAFTTNRDYHHGTHVAGLVGATSNNSSGIASIGYNTMIMPIRVTPEGTDETKVPFGLEGITWAADNNAKIINVSWGWKSDEAATAAEIAQIQTVIDYAYYNKGSIIVAAAGNKTNSFVPPFDIYPAKCANVISVANSNKFDRKFETSNFGKWVSIAAPGEGILSTMPSDAFGIESGTSMAAPLVSGTLALMFALNENLTQEEAIRCLLSGVDPVSDYVGLIGTGRLNAYNALTCVAAQLQANNNQNGSTSNRVFEALSAAPNPMRENTVIEYTLKVPSKVNLNVYNRFGENLPVLQSVYQEAGFQQVKFKRGNLPAGIYYYRLQAQEIVETKMLVIND